jgi:hypothetical protein
MTACPACGRHKGTQRLLCSGCAVTRTDIVPFCAAGLPWEQWLNYALGATRLVYISELLEPADLGGGK